MLAALMVLLVWPQAQAQSLTESGAAKAESLSAPSELGGSELLYDQIGSVPSGVVVQYNNTSSEFDALAADNFTVPNGLTWTVDVVASTGFYSGAATTGDCQRANAIIWSADGTGEPDAQLFNFDDIAPFFDSAANLQIGTIGVELPQPVALTAGDYWFSLVCEGDNLDVNTGGRWNWQFNDDIGLDPDAQFRNDGGGFGLPVGWNDYSSLFSGGRNNASFAIFGFESGTALLPELTVEQAGLMATAPPDAIATRVLTLRNTGTDELTWSIPEFDGPVAPVTAGFPQVAFRGYPSLQKPVLGSVFNRTGTDEAGYTFKDNDEPDGPAYNFTDISGTGTGTGLGDDQGVVVTLPFPFSFYGEVKTDVGISSNGYLSFGTDLTDFSPTVIPQDDAFNPNDLIAPYWDDFRPNLESSGDVYYQDMGDGRFIVQWDNVARFADRNGGTGVLNTFQVILFEDGAIEFQYGDNNAVDSGAGSIGIENADASIGLQVSFQEDGYPVSGRAVRFEQDLSVADFLTDAQPASGTLAPGEDVNVTVSFSSAGLGVGVYNDALTIVSNAGDVVVPATLEVVGPPEIFVDPLLLEATLESGQTETRPISITNTGLEDLEFSFAGYNDAAVQTVPNFGPRSKVTADKGAESTSSGTQSFGAGGPDGFGYVWVDSNEDGGPAVDFQDIVDTGVEITDGEWTPTGTFDPADEGYFDVALPFAFPYYGEPQSSIRVNTNGFAAFSTADTGNLFTNQPIPVADEPNGILAPFWDDFNLATSGSVFYGLTPDGRFAIQFNEVARFAAAELNTFQIILGEDGTIAYQYRTLGATTLNSATVGIENLDGTDGLQIAFNEDYLESEFAILIGVESPLVADVSPASGTVAPGETVTVTATVSANELFAGTYEDDLLIVSNDPVRPVTQVEVLVTVTGDPALTVSPMAIGFGEVMIGGSATETVTITNTGTDVLTITGISSDDDDVFEAGEAGVTTLAPGASTTFTVTFTPEVLAAVAGTITVSTDAGDAEISVAGVATPAPVLSVTPESLDIEVRVGEMSEPQTLTLQNDGVGVGTFSATAVVSGDVTTGPVTAELQTGAGEGLSARSSAAAPGTPGESTGTRTRKSGEQVTITHSESQEIVPLTGISCPTVPNAHLRVFELADFDISGDFDVTTVEFGIESMSFEEATDVILYTLDGDFVRDNLTEIARATATVGPQDDLSIVSVDIDATFSSSDIMVVEWFVPSARPFFGGNGAGESSPTYLQADGCNVFEPTPVADLGNFPANHWVVNVTGDVGASAEDIVLVTPQSGTVGPAQNQDLEVVIDASGLAAGGYEFVIDIATNDPMNPSITVPVTVTVATGVSTEDASIPTVFELTASVPNPAAAQTALRYAVPETSEVLIEVYDLMGRRITTLVDGEQTPGRKSIRWDASSLAGGVYVYRMTAGTFSQTMKMVVVR